MAVTKKLIENLDQLVEDVDYGCGGSQRSREADMKLANAVCKHWTDIEPILRASLGGKAKRAA